MAQASEFQRLVRFVAASHGLTRMAIGTGLLISPSRFGRTWLGDSVDSGAGDVALHAMAVRDAVIGLGTLEALRSRRSAKRWFGIGVAIEVAELSAMWRRRRELGPAAVPWAAVTAAGLVGGALISIFLDEHDESTP